MTNSITHRGEIVEKILRKSGYSLTKIAKQLGISRNTLYNKFENANLSYHFIMKVGKIVYYDFTIDFPEIKEEVDLLDKTQIPEQVGIGGKYIHLLEKYNSLLAVLVETANNNKLPDLHREIKQMLEKEAKI
jgi:transcriptional regulator with XRE-family HTH domain